jgi:HSP20 family protein
MTLSRWEPFREMLSLRDAFDRFFEDPFTRRGEWLAAVRGVPALDMYNVNGSIAIDIALPGVKPEEVEVNIVGNTLTVKGEHKNDEEVKEEDYYRHEVHYGTIMRVIDLPTYVDTEKVDARFDNGILKIVMPKLPEAQPKRIEIKEPAVTP